MSHDSAAELIVRARLLAGLTQTELASRSGVGQSVISDYERSRREPSLPMLNHLIEATGHHLSIELTPSGSTPSEFADAVLARRLARRRLEVLRIATEHGARNLRLFGSVARGDEHAASDIDLLVDLDAGTGLVGISALQRELSDLLEAPVDIVPADSLKPELRHVIDEAIPL